MTQKFVIAIDLGAESGRVMRAALVNDRLDLQPVHRFPNIPVQARDTLHWDALRLWHEIMTGIRLAADGAAGEAAGVALDAWGVDTVLLDRDGRLLSNPVHYRDPRTDGMMDWVFERVPRRTVFERTGIQFIQINGLYQNASLVKNNSPLLDAAATLLTLPDLFNYWLSGAKTCEFTDATTTQMYDPRKKDWDIDTLNAIGFPTHILTEVVEPGTRLGKFEGIPVFTAASHDTGSAVVAVPTTTENYAYLSSGTWSLIGLEVPEPIITDATYEANLTNEGGAYNTIRLLKNVAGMWLAQQCRATWAAAGQDYDYDQMVGIASQSTSFRSFFDPDAPEMLPPGDMPARIRDYCTRTGQPAPETPGQTMRAVYESLALKYRFVLDRLIAVSGKTVDRLHIIGGGSQNTLLCQMTADAIGRPVVAGPSEATAAGNAVVQLIALGELANLSEARQMLSRTFETVVYEPKNTAEWEAQYERFKGLPLTV